MRLGRLHQDLADNNEELQAAYETARESEAKYRALIHDAQDALFLIAPACRDHPGGQPPGAGTQRL